MPAEITDKKYLDAAGLAHFCQILNQFPNNDVIAAVIEGVQAMFDELGNAKIFSGGCTTAGSIPEKTVVCERFEQSELVTGAIIYVTFLNTNTYNTLSELTLNVNSTGAKPIKCMIGGVVSNIPTADSIAGNETLRFTYDGTNWITDVHALYNKTVIDMGDLVITDNDNGDVILETTAESSITDDDAGNVTITLGGEDDGND